MRAFYCFFFHFETFYSWNNQFLIVYTNLIVKIYNISTLYSGYFILFLGYFIYHFTFIYKNILFVIIYFIFIYISLLVIYIYVFVLLLFTFCLVHPLRRLRPLERKKLVKNTILVLLIWNLHSSLYSHDGFWHCV